MKEEKAPSCAVCSIKNMACREPEGRGPEGCPTTTRTEVLQRAMAEYRKPEVAKFAKMASLQEAEGYADRHIKPFVRRPSKPRLQEICEFSNKMGYRRLGVAFCGGLRAEARKLAEVLIAQGFQHPPDSPLHHDFVIYRLLDILIVDDLPGLPEGHEKLLRICRVCCGVLGRQRRGGGLVWGKAPTGDKAG